MQKTLDLPTDDRSGSTVCSKSVDRGADISKCGKYRYALWRGWNIDAPCKQVVFVGLNPSTADAMNDDPTIRRCVGFAKSWGFNRLVMVNAFAFRATNPKDMKAAENPIGDENEKTLKFWARRADSIIAAWGGNCDEARELEVCQTIGQPIWCLGKTKAGRPKHPLYLKADTERELFWTPSI